MKYILIFGLVLLVAWLWRRHRMQGKSDASGKPSAPTPARGITPMVECGLCKVHLPQSEAIPGASGALYCSEAHRRQSGG
ncbi:PP0621 family protein [Polaromonas sp. YR568]|uniref:PP0621 family protein n=1 Tax=Polaromonas sp. YR568 TaxID=1855301 RepID=UPI003137E5CB